MRLFARLRSFLRPVRHRDPQITAAIIDGTSHVLTNRRLLREIRAVQIQLERSGR